MRYLFIIYLPVFRVPRIKLSFASRINRHSILLIYPLSTVIPDK